MLLGCLPYPAGLECCRTPPPRTRASGSRGSFHPGNVRCGCYIYMEDLVKLDECRDPACPVQWPTCPSPVRLSNWLEFLRCHPDQTFASYIHSGLLSGFRIGYNRQAPRLKSAAKNHPSAPANAMVVRNHIEVELQAGRLVGPLNKALAPLLHTSPIGLVPKAHQPGKWRLIVDLSFPPGHSVNEGISPELASITYAKVDEAVEIIRQLGVGTQLAKLDLQSAYRIVPIHPEDQHLLAIEQHTWIAPYRLASALRQRFSQRWRIWWLGFCTVLESSISSTTLTISSSWEHLTQGRGQGHCQSHWRCSSC